MGGKRRGMKGVDWMVTGSRGSGVRSQRGWIAIMDSGCCLQRKYAARNHDLCCILYGGTAQDIVADEVCLALA